MGPLRFSNQLKSRGCIELAVDASSAPFVHVQPAQGDGNHGPEHQRVADHPHDVATDVQILHVGRAPGAVGGEVGREHLVTRSGQRQPREGVDRNGQEQIEELQRRVEAIAVGVRTKDLAPEEIADDEEHQVLGVVHTFVGERVVVPNSQMRYWDHDGVEHECDDGMAEHLGHR